jgi:hypothetical protein
MATPEANQSPTSPGRSPAESKSATDDCGAPIYVSVNQLNCESKLRPGLHPPTESNRSEGATHLHLGDPPTSFWISCAIFR